MKRNIYIPETQNSFDPERVLAEIEEEKQKIADESNELKEQGKSYVGEDGDINYQFSNKLMLGAYLEVIEIFDRLEAPMKAMVLNAVNTKVDNQIRLFFGIIHDHEQEDYDED
jgi:hypothetical protein